MLGGVYLLMAVMLILGALMSRREPAAKMVKMALAWIVIFAAGFVLISFRDDFGYFAQRLKAEAVGTTVEQGRETRIPMSIDGHFWVNARLNGKGVRFLIDSGATMTTIDRDTAVAAGVEVSPRRDQFVRTGNGVIRVSTGRAGELDVGAIVALSPDLSAVDRFLGVDDATVRTVLNSWGPGKFDATLFLDGKAFRPDGKTAATLIPAAFGLAGVNLHTYTGWGSVTYWNAFVANLEMHGQGTFFDPRLEDGSQFPIAASNGFGNVRNTPDLITPKLAALHFYQLSIPAPEPPPGSFDQGAANRGKDVFNGPGRCATCHVPPLFTEPGWNMHKPEDIGIDSFQADRAPDHRYRTTPLKGLFSHAKGGFYHDGRFATLDDVVAHYDAFFSLHLSDQQKRDLVEYLKSL